MRTTSSARSVFRALAKALAREFGEYGITANTVVPGAIDTERDWSQYKHFKPDEVVKEIAVKRIGTHRGCGGGLRLSRLARGPASSPARRCTSMAAQFMF